MNICWIEIKNINEYVTATLQAEASDIPQELLHKYPWVQEIISIHAINTDTEMISNHDSDTVHIKRRDGFVQRIQSGYPMLPLILLHSDRGENYLVDGYARYRALKMIGVKEVSVIKHHIM